MSNSKTALLLVIDAVGLDTLDYLLSKHPGPLNIPNLAALGLGEIVSPEHKAQIGAKTDADSFAARVEQASASADSVVGHREMMGVVDNRTFSLFPDGFPENYIRALELLVGRKTIFNKMAGGMEAIELNALEHETTGHPIVYASKCDPLIQIAMSEAVIPVREQHSIADAAFALAKEMGIPVTRAIARAYRRGPGGEIIRTANRHDAVLPLQGKTLPDILAVRGVWACAVGKTAELVNAGWHERVKLADKAFVSPQFVRGFIHPQGKDTNPLSAQGTYNAVAASKTVYRPNGTFIFSNFVDTDSLYGHTRDAEGALRCLEAADAMLGEIMRSLARGDLLIITADHGMAHRADYGYHNREPLPLLAKVSGGPAPKPANMKTLASAGLLVAEFFNCGKEFSAILKADAAARQTISGGNSL
ncbi:MAG: hypothetical protein WC421_01990 [Elusimicrobiales bacterium]